MINICSQGFKISSADKRALENDLLDTPYEWSQKCLTGMINKATKTIFKNYLEVYKSIHLDSIPNNISAIILTRIIEMIKFKPFNYSLPMFPSISRKEIADIEIWEGGFSIEPHEHLALINFYENPEQQMYWFMENKINECRKRFIKEWSDKLLKDRSVMSIPVKQDDLISLVTARPDYKNRAQRNNERPNLTRLPSTAL